MRFGAFLGILASVLPCMADPRTQKLLDRLAEEASAFAQAAPNLISRETLQQKALKVGKSRFRPRVEKDTLQPGWQAREIRSEYGYAALGNPPSIREIRKVLTVDGKNVNEDGQALREMLRSLQSADDRTRKKLLEDFEKHGLVGTVTDFGQLILLFGRSSQEHYEFYFQAERLTGADWCEVFEYRQHDGPGVLTIWEEKGQERPRVKGEIWVSRENYRVMKITLVSTRRDGAVAVRDEASVDYTMAVQGVVVPVELTHREYRNGELVAENLFAYEPFRRFGASSDVRFSPENQ